MTRPAPTAGSIAQGLEAEVRGGALPGAAWWVGGPSGVLETGAVGTVEGEPARPETPYDLASLTKPLATALLAVLLEQEGRLDLDAPLQAVLPEVRDAPAGRCTLLDLGAHRAGLPAWHPLSVSVRTRQEATAAIAALPLEDAGREIYSDLGYLLLGFAVERAGGAALDALFRDRIAVAVSPHRLGFPGHRDRFQDAAPTERGNVLERRMAGEAHTGHPWRTHIPRGEVHDANAHALGGVAGHAGLFGTAAAVGALACEILRPRRLALSSRARGRLLTPVATGGDRTFGFVLARGSTAARGVLPDSAPGHTGFTGTSLWLVPRAQAALVLLTNRVHPAVGDADFQPVRSAFHARALRSLQGEP